MEDLRLRSGEGLNPVELADILGDAFGVHGRRRILGRLGLLQLEGELADIDLFALSFQNRTGETPVVDEQIGRAAGRERV